MSAASEREFYNISQSNFYLDKLGIPAYAYGTNFTRIGDDREEEWQEQREKYGFDEREMWDTTKTFIEWLYSRCRWFLDHAPFAAGNYVVFEGTKYNHRAALEEICEDCRFYLTHDDADDSEQACDKANRAARLWAEVMFFTEW